MWGYSWPWIIWLAFFAIIMWAAFNWRSSRDYRGYGWHGGARYGGPDFGIPQGWPQSARGAYKGRGPRDYRRSDQRIEEDINDQLTISDAIDARDVHVSVHDGRVVLTGVVESRTDKRVAEALADSVPGTVDVENQLAIGRLGA